MADLSPRAAERYYNEHREEEGDEEEEEENVAVRVRTIPMFSEGKENSSNVGKRPMTGPTKKYDTTLGSRILGEQQQRMRFSTEGLPRDMARHTALESETSDVSLSASLDNFPMVLSRDIAMRSSFVSTEKKKRSHPHTPSAWNLNVFRDTNVRRSHNGSFRESTTSSASKTPKAVENIHQKLHNIVTSSYSELDTWSAHCERLEQVIALADGKKRVEGGIQGPESLGELTLRVRLYAATVAEEVVLLNKKVKIADAEREEIERTIDEMRDGRQLDLAQHAKERKELKTKMESLEENLSVEKEKSAASAVELEVSQTECAVLRSELQAAKEHIALQQRLMTDFSNGGGGRRGGGGPLRRTFSCPSLGSQALLPRPLLSNKMATPQSQGKFQNDIYRWMSLLGNDMLTPRTLDLAKGTIQEERGIVLDTSLFEDNLEREERVDSLEAQVASLREKLRMTEAENISLREVAKSAPLRDYPKAAIAGSSSSRNADVATAATPSKQTKNHLIKAEMEIIQMRNEVAKTRLALRESSSVLTESLTSLTPVKAAASPTQCATSKNTPVSLYPDTIAKRLQDTTRNLQEERLRNEGLTESLRVARIRLTEASRQLHEREEISAELRECGLQLENAVSEQLGEHESYDGHNATSSQGEDRNISNNNNSAAWSVFPGAVLQPLNLSRYYNRFLGASLQAEGGTSPFVDAERAHPPPPHTAPSSPERTQPLAPPTPLSPFGQIDNVL